MPYAVLWGGVVHILPPNRVRVRVRVRVGVRVRIRVRVRVRVRACRCCACRIGGTPSASVRVRG